MRKSTDSNGIRDMPLGIMSISIALIAIPLDVMHCIATNRMQSDAMHVFRIQKFESKKALLAVHRAGTTRPNALHYTVFAL